MSRYVQRPTVAVRVLLAAGAVALSAAACASQGVAGPAGGPATSKAGGSASGTPSVAETSAQGSATSSASASQSSPDVASASSSAPELPSDSLSSSGGAPITVKLTDPVTEGGFKFRIHFITLPYKPPANSTWQVPETKSWLLMDFEATNVSTQPLMFSTLGAFQLRDSDKNEYIVDVAGWESLPKDKQFQEREVNPGETVKGEEVFMVNQNAKGLKMTFKGNAWHASENPPVIDFGR